ncbi:MAG: hypothetical protein JXA30_10485 [Deltaproteobacteria bacterium]|nr:hypothetical protein [Deltaproteobacteria bacterium]
MERLSLKNLIFGIVTVPLFATAACSTEGSATIVCSPGQSADCQCLNGGIAKMLCLPDGSGYGPCQCDGADGSGSNAGGVGGTSSAPVAGSGANGGTSVAGAGDQIAGAGVLDASADGQAAGPGGLDAAVGGLMDAGPDGNAGTAGSSTTAGSGGTAGSAGAAGAAGTTNPATDDLDEVRQICVDTINNFRATVGLSPLARAPANVEACSDEGAKQDGESGNAHGSAGNCSAWRLSGSPLRGGQNACPGYRVGGWGGMGSTLGEVLVFCLNQMWAEGEPPQGRAACMQDYAGCFLKHGHYINMTDTSYTAVSCGFFNMGNNTWWMNQDF